MILAKKSKIIQRAPDHKKKTPWKKGITKTKASARYVNESEPQEQLKKKKEKNQRLRTSSCSNK